MQKQSGICYNRFASKFTNILKGMEKFKLTISVLAVLAAAVIMVADVFGAGTGAQYAANLGCVCAIFFLTAWGIAPRLKDKLNPLMCDEGSE